MSEIGSALVLKDSEMTINYKSAFCWLEPEFQSARNHRAARKMSEGYWTKREINNCLKCEKLV